LEAEESCVGTLRCPEGFRESAQRADPAKRVALRTAMRLQ